jgi:hypothetical protein
MAEAYRRKLKRSTTFNATHSSNPSVLANQYDVWYKGKNNDPPTELGV